MNDPQSTVQTASPHAFRPIMTLAWVAIAALAITMLLDAIGIVSDYMEVRLITRIMDGEDVSLSDVDSNDNRQAAIGGLQLVAALVTIIAFLVWLFRARKNLDGLVDGGEEISPGWAIGWWFVPIANLWKPYQVVSEVARGSHPRFAFRNDWQAAPVLAVLGFWWAAWIINGIVGRIVFRAAFSDPATPEEARMESWGFLAADAIDLVAAGLALMVVLQISKNQVAKHQRMTGGDPLPDGLS